MIIIFVFVYATAKDSRRKIKKENNLKDTNNAVYVLQLLFINQMRDGPDNPNNSTVQLVRKYNHWSGREKVRQL